MHTLLRWPLTTLIIAFIAITAFTCDDYKQTNEPLIHQADGYSSCENIHIMDPGLNAASDPLSIEKVTVEGQCLKIVVSFGGGCGDTSFRLYQSEEIMKSFPPQMNLFLDFKDNDDCEALIQKELNFDLNTLVLPYNTGTIVLNIQGSSESILHTY